MPVPGFASRGAGGEKCPISRFHRRKPIVRSPTLVKGKNIIARKTSPRSKGGSFPNLRHLVQTDSCARVIAAAIIQKRAGMGAAHTWSLAATATERSEIVRLMFIPPLHSNPEAYSVLEFARRGLRSNSAGPPAQNEAAPANWRNCSGSGTERQCDSASAPRNAGKRVMRSSSARSAVAPSKFSDRARSRLSASPAQPELPAR